MFLNKPMKLMKNRPHRPWTWSALGLCLTGALLACGGGGGGSSGGGFFVSPQGVEFLSDTEVSNIVGRAIQASLDRNQTSTIAVVDRVGNVLAVYQMTGAAVNTTITSGLNPTTVQLDGATVPSTLAAISKAITGAYLSSTGNAFSTRTASQIVQEFFQPGEVGQPSGPLYGVQFSQLPCSDLNVWLSQHATIGPKRSPLGLSADPGGFPIYENGRVVGGIGIIATPSGSAVNGTYGLDRNILDNDQDIEEQIAQAALPTEMRAPADIRANRITANGQTFQYANSDPAPASAASVLANGTFVAVAGYKSVSTPIAGTSYGQGASGYVPTSNAAFAGLNTFNLITNPADTTSARYPATAGAGGLSQAEVQNILVEGMKIANRSRAQIRRPLGSPADVTVSVVDSDGTILGLVRSSDAPIFGTDVSVQKARTALAFSSNTALTDLLDSGDNANDALVNALNAFFAQQAQVLDGTVAFSARAVGNVHRPYFPDGDTSQPKGPLSTAISETNNNWSPFNVGFQLNVVLNQVLGNLTGTGRAANVFDPALNTTCADPTVNAARQKRFANGMQIFPGGFPIYKGDTLVGAVGVSGDGVDQDDMIGYLGVINGATAAGTANMRPFPATLRRADGLSKGGQFLKYVQCPQAPFNDSNATNVCPNS